MAILDIGCTDGCTEDPRPRWIAHRHLHRPAVPNSHRVSENFDLRLDESWDWGTREKTAVSQLKNELNAQYLLTIGFGTPNSQLVSVIPDTGSFDVWVSGAECDGCAGAFFDPAKSESTQTVGDRRRVVYGDGTTVEGDTMKDLISVQADGELDVTTRTSFIWVTKYRSDVSMLADGILGLAHVPLKVSWNADPLHAVKSPTSFLTSLFTTHPEIPPMFSFFLTFQEDKHLTSALVFGDPLVPTFSKDEELRWAKHPAKDLRRQWLVELDSIGFSGSDWSVSVVGGRHRVTGSSDTPSLVGPHQREPLPPSGIPSIAHEAPTRDTLPATALVDSGTSLIIVRNDLWSLIYSRLRDLNLCFEDMTCRCPGGIWGGNFPTLRITLEAEDGGPLDLCLPPYEYVYKSRGVFFSSCHLSLQQGGENLPWSLILGMVTMRSYYVTFDAGNQRVGFARSKASAAPANFTCGVEGDMPANFGPWRAWMATLTFGFALLLILVFALLRSGACRFRRRAAVVEGRPEEQLLDTAATTHGSTAEDSYSRPPPTTQVD